MPIAAVALAFDPVVRLGGFAVRLETLVAAAGVLVALLVAALLAHRLRAAARGGVGLDDAPAAHLRLDDVLLLAVAAIPGALLGGRAGYVALHWGYYAADPGAIIDPAQGSLELATAVAGAALTAGYAARVVSGAAGAWFHVAALPTLLALGIGKVAMALGGRGQGAPSAVPWATSYVGPGPWGSLGPGIPSHPAQLYEAAAIGAVAVLVVVLLAAGLLRRADGLAWLVGIGGWAAARTLVAATWRDPEELGPLRAAQLVSLGLLLACAAGAAVLVWRRLPGRAPRGSIVEPDA